MSSRKKYVICLVTAVFAVFIVAGSYAYIDSKNSSIEMNELSSVAYSSNEIEIKALENESLAVTQPIASTVSSIESDNENASVQKVDIKSLQNANSDIIAWISVPGTRIDYPIVQHPTNDTYYLSHGPEGTKSSHGCPYIETCDDKTFQDFNTVIYGHNMNDGSMFAGLHDFEDKDFLNENRKITVTTVDHVMTYTIFASVMYSDAYIPYYFNDAVADDRVAFLNSLEKDIVPERSILLKDIEVGAKDHIITLSTCDKKLRSNRFLVVAVLTQIDGVDV